VQSRIILVFVLGSAAALAASQSQAPPAAGVLQAEGPVGVRTQDAGQATAIGPRPAPVTQLDLNQRDPVLDGARMSLVFEQPVRIRQVLMLLVRGTALSVLPSPGPALDQTLVADLKNVTIRETLDAILEPLGLDYTVSRRLLRVFPRELETRLYDVDYVTASQTDGTADFYADLADGVRGLLSADGRMHLDRAASLLQVSDRPGRLQRVEGYVQAALRRALRQIQLDATAIEIDLADPSSAGLDWTALLDAVAPGTSASSRAGLSIVRLPQGSVQPVIEALGRQGTVRVLARSRVLATNNQPAFVRSETDQGFSLTVTPQISSTGLVSMRVHPRITEQLRQDAEPRGPLSIRETDTLVRVPHGETLILSGFVQSSDGGVRPWRKTDMVILLTPAIVAPGERAAASKIP